MTKDSRIMVGCPIQEKREWIVPFYLANLKALEYPKEKLHPTFLYNYPKGMKGEAEVLKMLIAYRDLHEDEYKDFTIVEAEGKSSYDDTRTPHRFYSYFAEIRNQWMDLINKKDKYILSIDSDILFPPQGLRHLLNWNLDVVSGFIYNGGEGTGQTYNYMIKMIDKKMTDHGEEYVYAHRPPGFLKVASDWAYNPDDGYYHIIRPAEVGVTGANILFKREVYDAGVRYGLHSQGEDVYWSERAIEAGFKLYCDCTLTPQHIMTAEQMDNLLKLPPGVSVEMPKRDPHLIEVNLDPSVEIIKSY